MDSRENGIRKKAGNRLLTRAAQKRTRVIVRALILALAVLEPVLLAQETVTIRIEADAPAIPLKPIWRYFGYDEPNYTYTENGAKLIGELAASSPAPVYIRAHNLLTTGDGTPALKWGSTNAYTKDGSGKPVYDWTIVDRIFDTYVKRGTRPFVEVGFTPEALSTKPQPYRHSWPKGDLFTGWTYPPNDFREWSTLIRKWTEHEVARYGKAEVLTWYWEFWNEPDIGYWHGSPEQYDAFYDETANAIKEVLPGARVGGPALTGAAGSKAAAYLRQFLEHCASGTNHATGAKGAPLDFVSYHAKGSPKLVDGHVEMAVNRELAQVKAGIEIINGFPKFRGLPIVLSEADPEGCAACSARMHPENAYRNGPLYPCYTAVMLANIFKLADRMHANIEGMLTWAFEFEGQPYFEGFRTLATNGVDKPILNLFRMAGMMAGGRIPTASTGAVGLDAILRDGVRGRPDIDALASRSARQVSVLVWNYHDDDVPGPDAPVRLAISGLPASASRTLLAHFRIDAGHSNAYAAWKMLGSPQDPSPEQKSKLEAAGQLELLESPRWLTIQNGTADIIFSLPRQAVSLVQLSW